MYHSADIAKMVIISVAIVAIIALGGGYVLGHYIIENDSGSKSSYYRGIYDVCHSGAKIPAEECLALVGKSVEMQWFEDVSDGWVWQHGSEK